eukprot:6492287-Amphidinium_carterae.1
MSCTPPQSDCLRAAVYSCDSNPSSAAVCCRRCGGAVSQSVAVESRRLCTSAEVGGAALMTLARAANKQWFCSAMPGLYKGRGCRRSRVLGEPSSHLGATKNCAAAASIELVVSGPHNDDIQGSQSGPVKVSRRARDSHKANDEDRGAHGQIDIVHQEGLWLGEVHLRVVGIQHLRGTDILHVYSDPEEQVVEIVIMRGLSGPVGKGSVVITQQLRSIDITRALIGPGEQLHENVITHGLNDTVGKEGVVCTHEFMSIDIMRALIDPEVQLHNIVITHGLNEPVGKGEVVCAQRLRIIDILRALNDPEGRVHEIDITHGLYVAVGKGGGVSIRRFHSIVEPNDICVLA